MSNIIYLDDEQECPSCGHLGKEHHRISARPFDKQGCYKYVPSIDSIYSKRCPCTEHFRKEKLAA